MELRPHHGMCFQFYEGKGYSEDFTDHMGRVIAQLEKDPSQKVKLTVATDVVCENCPNNEEGSCTTLEKVTRYDEEVLKACDLAEGEEISFGRLLQGMRVLSALHGRYTDKPVQPYEPYAKARIQRRMAQRILAGRDGKGRKLHKLRGMSAQVSIWAEYSGAA